MAFGGKQFHCWMSCDDELANEWARCSGKNASYITIVTRTIFNNMRYIQLQVWKNHVVHLVSTAKSWHLENQAGRNLQKRRQGTRSKSKFSLQYRYIHYWAGDEN